MTIAALHPPLSPHERDRARRGARRPRRLIEVFAAALLLATAALSPAGLADASEGGESAYVTHRLCAAPSPGHVSCLGLRLAPTLASGAPTARALLRHGRGGSTGASPLAPATVTPASATPAPVAPADLHAAYELPTEPVAGSAAQTIALVDAYDDPTAEADLATFDERFGLPACTRANGCFSKVNQNGEPSPLPAVEGGWAAEIATDIETAHSLCESCHILLVEARSTSYSNLQAAETAAWRLGATEISNSWGGEEPGGDSAVFNRPGTVITASAGDAGYLNWMEPEFSGADYPASSPHVVAVGGTSLHVSTAGAWLSESVWNDSAGATGGGCSGEFAAPSWQRATPDWSSVGCGGYRAVADVAADADPYTGVYVYDSTPEREGEAAGGWMLIGGTSVASPIVAATFALAGGSHGVEYPAATLYSHLGSGSLHDVTVGGSGKCDGTYTGGCSGSLSSKTDCGGAALICNAATGYDGPTGVGTPHGLGAFELGGSEPSSGSEPEEAPKEEASPAPPPEESPSLPAPAQSEGTTAPGGGEASVGGLSGAESSTGPTEGGRAPGAESSEQRPRISRLRLTGGARSAIAARRLRLSSLSFSFRSSAGARVRFVLRIRMRVRGRPIWVLIRRRHSVWAHAGRNHGRLPGREWLPAGRYKLTVGPPGAARSLRFRVRG